MITVNTRWMRWNAALRARLARCAEGAWTLGSVLGLAVSMIAIAACGSSVRTPSEPSGTYATTFSDLAKALDGTWTVKFAKNGSYTIQRRLIGLATGPGSYWRGHAFVIKTVYPGACGGGEGKGTYTLKLRGNQLRFALVSDPCSLRSKILGHTFTKKS
jgi:hypothetical protein